MSACDVLCACCRGAENKPDRACPVCMGRGLVCGVCLNSGRLADAPCPSCDCGADYFASLPPDAEQIRLARELAVMLA
jgi:hypothetical protein